MALHFTLARYNFLLSSSLLAGVLLIGTIAIAVHGIRIR
jgi:hypothetical protein